MRALVYTIVGISVIGIGAVGYALFNVDPTPLTDDERTPLYTSNTPTPTTAETHRSLPQPTGLQQVTAKWDAFVRSYNGTPPKPKQATLTTRTPSAVLPTYDPTPITTPPPPDATVPYTPPELSLPSKRTDEDVRAYGNTMGATIQSAVAAMGDQNATLMAFITDPSHREDVLSLSRRYDTLARDIQLLKHAVGFREAAHNLALGYTHVAEGLRVLADAKPDAMYSSLLEYNTRVEKFADSFVSYASLFGAYGVTFSATEPGGIFTPITTAI